VPGSGVSRPAKLNAGLSNGSAEGQTNRLKAIKRHMYGWAAFELLKAGVMPFEALAVA
jgi:transposase